MVGEFSECGVLLPQADRFSLVAEIGWLARIEPTGGTTVSPRFSLVAEIGWLASHELGSVDPSSVLFQSRCRDWVVGEKG